MAPPTVPLGIPATIVAGDTVVWDDPIFSDPRGPFGSDLYTLLYELSSPRTRVEGVSATQGGGWRTTLSSDLTSGLKTAGSTAVEPVRYAASVSRAGERYTVLSGTILIEPDPVRLGAYSTPLEQELAEVTATIRRIQTSGLQRYGVGIRNYEKVELKTLYARQASLKEAIRRQRQQGLSRTHLVTFNPSC